MTTDYSRYQRQIVFPGLGAEGQRRLASASVLVVGVGGLGSWSSQLLARAGVGRMRLVDDDKVELMNLHRQTFYTETDAEQGRSKAYAASAAIAKINTQVQAEAVQTRLTAKNIDELARDVDMVLDGTDNFLTRFVINDYCVKEGKPWVFAGVVAAEGQVMTILPGQTRCMRCVHDEPVPPCVDPNCRWAGVVGPAVATVAAIQAAEAMKILAGRTDLASRHMLKINLWDNTVQRLGMQLPDGENDCPCCGLGRYEYLD